MEALGLVASEFLELCDLLQGLDALRGDVQAECTGEGDDGCHDRTGRAIDAQVADEAAVDLTPSTGKLLR